VWAVVTGNEVCAHETVVGSFDRGRSPLLPWGSLFKRASTLRSLWGSPSRVALALVCVIGLPGVATASVGTAAGPGVEAESNRVVAIPPFVIEGKLPAAAREKIEADLVEAVERAGFVVVPPATVGSPCQTEDCATELGSKTDATHVLQVWIKQDGRDYQVRMVLSSAANGTEVATFAQSCDICGMVELGEVVTGHSAGLRDKLAVIPATLIVQTKPSGALVRVDGEVMGTSPLRETVSPGAHVVEVEKRGFHMRRRELTLVEGDEETFSFELVALEVTQAAAKEKRDLSKPLGWASFGVGLGLLGGAVPLLVMNGRPVKNRCDGDNLDINGLCRYRYRTMIPGAVLAGVGGALVVTGIALIAVHAKRKGKGDVDDRAKRARLMIGPTDVGVAVRF
jgi:hypothetical protein